MKSTENETLIAFSYCGDHIKSIVGRVSPIEHVTTLLKCMDNVNPKDEYPMAVSATRLTIDLPCESERLVTWEIFKRATVITTKENPGHQRGACWIIRYAFEYAAMMGFKYMFFTADDVMFSNPDVVEKVVTRMKEEDLGYLGANWGSPNTLSTQVFCAKVEDFANIEKKQFIINPVVFGGKGCILEEYMYEIVNKFNIKYQVRPTISYTHSHHLNKLLNITKKELAKAAKPDQY